MSLQQKVVCVFGAALLVLFIVAADSIGNLKRVEMATEEVTRTYGTYTALAELIGHMRDIETGQRGFVVTGEEAFLEPYRDGLENLSSDLARLRALVSDDPAQAARLDTLQELVAAKVRISRQIVDARREHGFEAAAAIVGEGQGRATMDGIRASIARLKEHETALLFGAEQDQRSSVWNATVVSIVGFLIAFVIGVIAMLAVRRDIGRREAAEAHALQLRDEAEAANRAKSDFLARMSHELRTPLNSIIGFSGILLKNKGGNLHDRELSYLDRIQINGRHLLALINDILDLSRIEADRAEVVLEPVFLDVLIRETLAQLDERAAGKAVVLRTDLPAVIAPVEADAGKLKQVLINLVGNALKFTPEGAIKVLLFVHPASGKPLRVDVMDTGIGIPPHRLDAIFAAFEQADRSVTQRFGGTGLGLTISRSLCTLMGYGLHVQSEVGRGSIFSILLDPAAPLPQWMAGSARGEAAEPGSAPAPDGMEEDGELVLVIDDEADSRTLLRHILEEAGYRVITAVSATEGLEMMRLHRPDAVTLDILMPPETGMDVLDCMEQEAGIRGTPVVVVSIVAEESRGWGAQAFEHLRKPVLREDLVDAVRRAIAERARTAAAA